MISYQSSQDCLGINKILSPAKNTLQITFNILEIEVHDFLPIVICENWNFLQISASEPWASPKFQPGLNPKILLLSQRRWGLRFPQNTNDLRTEGHPDPPIHSMTISGTKTRGFRFGKTKFTPSSHFRPAARFWTNPFTSLKFRVHTCEMVTLSSIL